MENAADRYEKSAARWARKVEAEESAYPFPKGSLDADAREGFSLDNESDAIAHAALRLLAGQRITSLHLDLWDLRETCKSPIELPLVLALMTVARHDSVSVKLVDPDGREYGDAFEVVGRKRFPEWTLRIEPQAQLGEHRVDFLLTIEGTVRTAEGRMRSAMQRMVVECDGHDFHERTKDQAKRDRERDRLLQSFGFLVYRYTGSEIWGDVFACAAQTFESLQAPVLRTLYPPPWRGSSSIVPLGGRARYRLGWDRLGERARSC